MRILILAIFLTLTTIANALQAEDESEKIEKAKVAEAAFHAACQQWDTDHRAGKDMAEATKNLEQIYNKFRGAVYQTRYRDCLNNAVLYPHVVSYAGQIELDGQKFSYITGSGQTGYVFSRWYQTEWTERSIPGNGLQTMGIESKKLRDQFAPALAKWITTDPPRLRVPYKMGTIEGHLDLCFIKEERDKGNGEKVNYTRAKFEPDRGTLDGDWWKPEQAPLKGAASK